MRSRPARAPAEDALRSPDSGLDETTRDDAADWLNRLSDWAVSGRPDDFRTYCLIAIAAGLLAIVVALPRRPLSIWPEVAWGLCAVAGLAPNLAFDLWFTIWAFTGSLVAGAAVIHYLARRDDHVRRAGDVARRAGTAAAPHVGSALARGSRATDAVARVRGGGGGAGPGGGGPGGGGPGGSGPGAAAAAPPASSPPGRDPAARVPRRPPPRLHSPRGRPQARLPRLRRRRPEDRRLARPAFAAARRTRTGPARSRRSTPRPRSREAVAAALATLTFAAGDRY